MSKIILFIWFFLSLLSSVFAINISPTRTQWCWTHVNFDVYIILFLFSIIGIILIIKFYSKFKAYSILSRIIIVAILVILLYFSFQMTYDPWCGGEIVKYKYDFTQTSYRIEYNLKLLP